MLKIWYENSLLLTFCLWMVSRLFSGIPNRNINHASESLRILAFLSAIWSLSTLLGFVVASTLSSLFLSHFVWSQLLAVRKGIHPIVGSQGPHRLPLKSAGFTGPPLKRGGYPGTGEMPGCEMWESGESENPPGLFGAKPIGLRFPFIMDFQWSPRLPLQKFGYHDVGLGASLGGGEIVSGGPGASGFVVRKVIGLHFRFVPLSLYKDLKSCPGSSIDSLEVGGNATGSAVSADWNQASLKRLLFLPNCGYLKKY